MATSAISPPVLHVVTDVERRGAQVAALDLHESLLERGWRSRIVALGPGRSGAAVLPIPVLAGRQRSPAALLGLRRSARGAGVVVAHGSTTLPAAALAVVGAAPFVYVNIGDPRSWLSTRRRLTQTRLLMSRAAAVAAISPLAAGVLTSLVRVRPDRVVVTPNVRSGTRFHPFDPDQRAAVRRELGWAPERPVLLHLGAATAEKRHDLVLDVAAQLPDVHVVMAGPLPAGDLRDRAASVGVEMLGPVDVPERYLAAADVVILTSDTEGLPGVLVEAGLCGVPVVSTDVGFVSDVVLDGQTGRLAPRGDAAALALAVRDCLNNRVRWGAAARVHCMDRFTTEAVLPLWEDLLRRVAAGRPPAGPPPGEQEG